MVGPRTMLNWNEMFLFYVIFEDVSAILVTAHRWAGGLKKIGIWHWLPCHRHFVGFLLCPSKHRCNIKKWPRWKMTPRVIFQRKKWLPGSFFYVKSWHGSNFNIKYWTTGREKVTPRMKFWPPGGSFFNDISILKISLYTPANEVLEVYWATMDVCLSVCLSVKKWFLYNNSSSI